MRNRRPCLTTLQCSYVRKPVGRKTENPHTIRRVGHGVPGIEVSSVVHAYHNWKGKCSEIYDWTNVIPHGMLNGIYPEKFILYCDTILPFVDLKYGDCMM